MAIEVLGKSLLSAARKKNKKRQRIGNMAALAYVGMSAANSLIRKKAIKRAKEFENGLLPLETALNGEYLRIEKAKTKYNDIMEKKGETGTVREVFSNAEKTRLQKLVNASATTAKYNDEELNQLAFNDSQDEYDAWVNDTETYKPFFDVTKDDYFKNFETLKTEGKKDKLKLEKTDISDVYQIYNKDDEKLGIAHIPNLKISLYCKKIFEDKNKEYFNCIYNNHFKKWIPLKKTDSMDNITVINQVQITLDSLE